MKVLIVGNIHYGNWIKDAIIEQYNNLSDIKDADIVLFTGGEDINPKRYRENPHHLTSSNDRRDEMDFTIAKEAKIQGKLLIGICRGAQLLTVFSGGKLIQHVNNHAISGTHEITTNDGDKFEVTSTHHQMMHPYQVEKKTLAWSSTNLSDVYFKNAVEIYEDIKKELEVVFYPRTNALAIQPHPEMMDKNSKFIQWLNELILHYTKNKTQSNYTTLEEAYYEAKIAANVNESPQIDSIEEAFKRYESHLRETAKAKEKRGFLEYGDSGIVWEIQRTVTQKLDKDI